MTELDYRICKIIKLYNEIHGIDPTAKDIAEVIKYEDYGARYHLNKLEKLGIVKTNGFKHNKRYILNVDNLE